MKTRLSRGHAFSFGAALAAAGFVTSCDESVAPPYGLACTPTTCSPIPASGGNAGAPVVAGSGSVLPGGGNAGAPLVAGSGGASSGGGNAGAPVVAGSGGVSSGSGGDVTTSENAGNGGAGGDR